MKLAPENSCRGLERPLAEIQNRACTGKLVAQGLERFDVEREEDEIALVDLLGAECCDRRFGRFLVLDLDREPDPPAQKRKRLVERGDVRRAGSGGASWQITRRPSAPRRTSNST